MNEQITEQTNNEGANGTDASLAAEVSVAAENSSADNSANSGADNGTENSGTVTSNPQENAKGSEETQEGSTSEEKPKQDATKNKEFARQRREREREAERKKARFEGIKEVLTKNPYTNKPIEDDSDVEEYLLMKKIEEDGKDPITDYPEYVKKQARETSRQAAKNEETNAKISRDIEEFAVKHPNVDLNEVLADEAFQAFAEGKLEKKTISEVYSSYLPFKAAIEGTKLKAQKEAHSKAVASAAVGSLTNASEPADKDFFTREQVLRMSPEEVHKNYEKIRESQRKW